MTDAQIEKLIKDAGLRGRYVPRWEARAYLTAKELLASDPNHEIAQQVVKEFSNFIRTGVKVESFASFALPEVKTFEELQRWPEPSKTVSAL
jgi:hypothetical protein